MTEMNCVRPNVTAEQEFNHLVRNYGFDQIQRLKEIAETNANTNMLGSKEMAAVSCWRDLLRAAGSVKVA